MSGTYASATGIVYETKKALKDFKEATTLRDLDEVTAKDILMLLKKEIHLPKNGRGSWTEIGTCSREYCIDG